MREDKVGSIVEVDLPPAHGGRQKLKVMMGSSCGVCAFSKLRAECEETKCSRDDRADGHNVVYIRDE